MCRRFLLVVAAVALGCAAPARAQTSPAGFEMANSVIARMVRVTGRQSAAGGGQVGYGLITGEERNADGETVLLAVVPYNVVRDPAQPGAAFQPPGIAFAREPQRFHTGEVLRESLPPDRGNLALVSLRKPAWFHAVPAVMADSGTVLPGVPVWQAGVAGEFAAARAVGRLAYQDQVGWLLFDGIDNTAGAIGAGVVNEHGVIGLAMGPAPQDPIATRVIPLAFVAMRVRAWGHVWDIPAEGSAGARPPVAGPGRPAPARPRDGGALAPLGMVALLEAEAAARSSWVPRGAKVSPWFDHPAGLFGSPRREAPMVGVMPAGSALPEDLWRAGAYDIVRKLDGGAWFQIATTGEDLGFVSGAEIVEVWPAGRVGGAGGADGRVVRRWRQGGGAEGVLRDAGAAFEIEAEVECMLPRCHGAILFTPRPPDAGAVVPTFQTAPLRGMWRKGERIPLRTMVPRQVIESRGAVVLGCAGEPDECPRVIVYPPSSP